MRKDTSKRLDIYIHVDAQHVAQLSAHLAKTVWFVYFMSLIRCYFWEGMFHNNWDGYFVALTNRSSTAVLKVFNKHWRQISEPDDMYV